MRKPVGLDYVVKLAVSMYPQAATPRRLEEEFWKSWKAIKRREGGYSETKGYRIVALRLYRDGTQELVTEPRARRIALCIDTDKEVVRGSES